ncbi:hypothetical protein SH449x_001119 [Pirellulaceae bacterium SH449]
MKVRLERLENRIAKLLLLLGIALSSFTCNDFALALQSLEDKESHRDESDSRLESKQKTRVRLFGRVATFEGQAVEASRVQLISPKMPSDVHTLTDANGQYELGFDLERTKLFEVLLMVETGDGSLLGYAAPTLDAGFLETAESRLDLTLYKPRDIEIVVIDENRFAVDGGMVCLSQSPNVCLGPYTTGKDGVVKVRIPHMDQQWTIFAGKKVVGFCVKSLPIINAVGMPTTVHAMLEPAQPMRIQLSGSENQPVVGAQVRVEGFRREAQDFQFPIARFFDFVTEETDDAGEAWLDALPFGVVTLSCSHTNYEAYFRILNHDKGPEFVHKVSLREMVTNRCLVVDEMGQPLVDTNIDIRSNSIPWFWNEDTYRTDSNGMIKFSVVVGKPYMLIATLGERGSPAITGFGIKDQLREEVQELRLGPMRTITGTVRSKGAEEVVPDRIVYLSQLGAGLDSIRHMRGAELIAVWMRPVITKLAKTDAEGRFQFVVPEGEYNLSLSPSENHSNRFRIPTNGIQEFDLTIEENN